MSCRSCSLLAHQWGMATLRYSNEKVSPYRPCLVVHSALAETQQEVTARLSLDVPEQEAMLQCALLARRCGTHARMRMKPSECNLLGPSLARPSGNEVTKEAACPPYLPASSAFTLRPGPVCTCRLTTVNGAPAVWALTVSGAPAC